MAQQVSLDTIVSLAKRRGFVFPGSEIYGGLANSWDYGPLGAQLRKNIKDSWWKAFVESRSNMVGLDGAIIMNPKVWEASGHTATFFDMMAEDAVTHKRYRADQLKDSSQSPEGNPVSQAKQFNLMFETVIGPVREQGSVAYLRPETAQAMFVNFKNVLTTSRKRLPFGMAQVGKAFRNEITPGNFIFRTLEFEQMEIEYFVEEKDWPKAFEKWMSDMEAWAKSIGISGEGLHRHEVPKEDLAHYSQRTVDFEFDFPFGREELWGIAYRGNFDLKNHSEHSGEKLEYADPESGEKFIPHVVEPTFGVDRTLLALLVSAYDEEPVKSPDGDHGPGEVRVVLRFKPHIAPVQVAVLPLMRKEELTKVAEKVAEDLRKDFRVEYDVTGSIGKRYRRQDEIGTPFAVTVDYETLEDNAATVRDRDSMRQERIVMGNLSDYLKGKLTENL